MLVTAPEKKQMVGTARCAVSARAKPRAQRTLARHTLWHAMAVAHTLRWATVTAQRAVPTHRKKISILKNFTCEIQCFIA